jgi:hypothetical protein
MNIDNVQKYESPGTHECLSCRIIGSGALGAVGLYALNQSRASAPGSLFGKRILMGLGLCASTWYLEKEKKY